MLKLGINYNPYLIKTTFLLNGEPLRSDSKLHEFSNQKIQTWIQNIISILSSEKDFKTLNICFKGRDVDFQDLANLFKNNNNVKLEQVQILDSAERMKKLRKLFKKIQDGPYEKLKSDKVAEYFEKTFSSEFEVGVIATMSSGKSTLLNSMLENDLIPSKNQACTAKISKIYDNKTYQTYKGIAYSKEKQVKELNILTNEDLKSLNDDENVDLIEIHGNIKNIKSEQTQLVLIDTPGPNNANDIKHKNLTYSLIKKDYKPLILYILNYEQLGITDDKALLEYIGEEIEKCGDKQSSERFIFVINKFDSYFSNPNDDPIPNTIAKVKGYLKGVGIDNPIIIPVSAYASLLIRGGYDQDNRKIKRIRDSKIADLIEAYEDDNFNINTFMNISPSITNKINNYIKLNEENDDEIVDYLTGIPALEEYINEYLEKYAVPEKIKKASETFSNFIKKEEIENKIFEEMKQSDGQLEEWKKNIAFIEKKYKQEVPNIRKRLHLLIKDIKKNMLTKIENYEVKIESISNKLLKTKGNESSSKSTAMQEVKTYIKKLQEEYVKLKSEMEQDVSKSLNIEISKLIKFYEKEISNITGNDIDTKSLEMIKDVLKFDVKSNIDFNENNLEDILYKTRT